MKQYIVIDPTTLLLEIVEMPAKCGLDARRYIDAWETVRRGNRIALEQVERGCR